MVNLRCHSSVSQWEREQISHYPEIVLFTDKLKSMICDNPERGFDDPLLFGGNIIPCRKCSLNVSLFSRQYTIGYEYITAHYVFNETDIFIIKMKWGL
jgi:hypothetical protein